MVDTMVKYINVLSSKQLDFIAGLIIRSGTRDGFHKGLLPFVPCQEVADLIKWELERLKDTTAVELSLPQIGEKFRKNLLSIMSASLTKAAVEGKSTVLMYLSTKKLIKRYGSWRVKPKFALRMADALNRKKFLLVELEAKGINKWEVTASSEDIEAVTLVLSEYNLNGVKP